MKLNQNAVRDILLFIESNVHYDADPSYIMQGDIIKGVSSDNHYPEDEIKYAVDVLLTTDFLNLVGKPVYSPDGGLLMMKVKGLTFAGCNFLDSIRQPEIWEVVKKKAANIGGTSIAALAGAGAGLANALMTDPNAMNNFLDGVTNIKQMLM